MMGLNKINKTLSLSFTSWFCVLEQGMKDLEPLVRSSSFILPTIDKKFDAKYHLLTVGHATAPWKFPRLYNQEWLNHVNEKHTYYTTELRHENGELLTQLVMRPRVYHHPSRDLSIIHFDKEDEEKIHSHLVKCEVKLDLQLSRDDFYAEKEGSAPVTAAPTPASPFGSPADAPAATPASNEIFRFLGYNLVDNSVPNFDNFSGAPTDGPIEAALMVPTTVEGTYLGRTKAQSFAKTQTILQQGMCGGPVLTKKRENGILKERLIGMLEGIVPADHPAPEIRNAAVFVEAGELRQFIKDIEAGLIEPVEGGQVLEDLAKNIDEEKLDFRNFL